MINKKIEYEYLFQKNYNRSKIKVSVIVPSYKPRVWFKECIRSIYNQNINIAKIEVIIVLNGPKAGYFSFIMNELVKYDHLNISLLYSFKQGVSRARNIGIDIAIGEYICFVDDDDWISEYYISELLECVDRGYIGLAMMIDFKSENQFYESYFNKCYIKNKNKNNIHILDVRSWFSVPVIKIIPRRFVGEIRFFEKISNGEDALFMFDIVCKSMKFCFTSQKAIYYRRITDDGLVASLKRRGYLRQFVYGLKLSFLFTKHYVKSGFKQNFIFYCTRVMAPFKGLFK